MLDDSWFDVTRHGTWLLRDLGRPSENGAPAAQPKLTAADLAYTTAYIDDGGPSDYSQSPLGRRNPQ